MALLPLDASITLMFLHYSCPHMPPSSKFEMSEGDMLSQLSMTDLRSLLCNRTFSWVAAMALLPAAEVLLFDFDERDQPRVLWKTEENIAPARTVLDHKTDEKSRSGVV
jgi:hypothetical protein